MSFLHPRWLEKNMWFLETVLEFRAKTIGGSTQPHVQRYYCGTGYMSIAMYWPKRRILELKDENRIVVLDFVNASSLHIDNKYGS